MLKSVNCDPLKIIKAQRSVKTVTIALQKVELSEDMTRWALKIFSVNNLMSIGALLVDSELLILFYS